MNNDGWGQVGAGQSDMGLAGEDLQHKSQKDKKPKREPEYEPDVVHRTERQQGNGGGPMREQMDAELARHNEAGALTRKHLEDHYKRPFDSQYRS